MQARFFKHVPPWSWLSEKLQTISNKNLRYFTCRDGEATNSCHYTTVRDDVWHRIVTRACVLDYFHCYVVRIVSCFVNFLKDLIFTYVVGTGQLWGNTWFSSLTNKIEYQDVFTTMFSLFFTSMFSVTHNKCAWFANHRQHESSLPISRILVQLVSF